MTDGKQDQQIEELTLILLYLTSWEEGKNEFRIRRSWKGYDFDALNELEDRNLISGSRRAKSVCFSDQGIDEAEKLLKKYGLGESYNQ